MYGRGQQKPGVGFGPPVTPTVIKGLLIAKRFVALAAQIRSGFAAAALVERYDIREFPIKGRELKDSVLS